MRAGEFFQFTNLYTYAAMIVVPVDFEKINLQTFTLSNTLACAINFSHSHECEISSYKLYRQEAKFSFSLKADRSYVTLLKLHYSKATHVYIYNDHIYW